MNTLVNIIHPYVFKVEEGIPRIGPIEEFRERDEKLAYFLKTALEKEVKVLHQRDKHPETIEGGFGNVAFRFDPVYPFLFHPSVEVAVTLKGFPILNAKPKEVPPDVWRDFKKYYTSNRELKKKVGDPKVTLFIGGFLERCLANAMLYHNDNFRKQGQQVVYVPELCVSLDEEEKRVIEPKFHDRKILPVSYDEALRCLGEA